MSFVFFYSSEQEWQGQRATAEASPPGQDSLLQPCHLFCSLRKPQVFRLGGGRGNQQDCLEKELAQPTPASLFCHAAQLISLPSTVRKRQLVPGEEFLLHNAGAPKRLRSPTKTRFKHKAAIVSSANFHGCQRGGSHGNPKAQVEYLGWSPPVFRTPLNKTQRPHSQNQLGWHKDRLLRTLG